MNQFSLQLWFSSLILGRSVSKPSIKSVRIGLPALSLAAMWMLGPSPTYAQNATTNSVTAQSEKKPNTLSDAAMLYKQGKQDEALNVVNAILQADPKDINAYILRGAIYSQKKVWDQAEKDYQAALQMDSTNDGVRYDLADLKFRQKQFDDARLAFVPLQNSHDADVADLIKYKIFLCDLLGGHNDIAGKEILAFNQVGSNPSYYFSNAAWNLVQKKPEEARGWLVSAGHIYTDRKLMLYASMLDEMGYLPLSPPPTEK